MNNYEETEDIMILDKAGDCLQYALGQEIVGADSNKHDHLEAFIAYFTLIGVIDRKNLMILKDFAWHIERNAPSFSEKYSYVVGILVEHLKKHYSFTDSFEMFRVLNKTIIPAWVFEAADIILCMLPDIYLIKDGLFYIQNGLEGELFRYTSTKSIDDLLTSYGDIGLDYETTAHCTISTLYTEIVACNDKKREIYLRLKNSDDYFALYCVDYDQEILYPYKCLGVIDNEIPLLDLGTNIAIMQNDMITTIRPKNMRESYKTEKGAVLVTPFLDSDVPGFFEPYILQINGTTEPYRYEESVSFLTNSIEEELIRYDSEDDLDMDEENAYMIVDSDRDYSCFSLNYLYGVLASFSPEENRAALLYEKVVGILNKYVDEDEEILGLFYMLIDVSRRLEKNPGKNLLSEGLYNRLEMLDDNGLLEALINDVELAPKVLLEDAYWDDKQLADFDAKENIQAQKSKIGGFKITKNKVITQNEEPMRKTIISKSVVPILSNEYPGLIVYNLELGIYEIQYSRILTKSEKKKVAEAFNIEDGKYRVYINKVSSPRMIVSVI